MRVRMSVEGEDEGDNETWQRCPSTLMRDMDDGIGLDQAETRPSVV